MMGSKILIDTYFVALAITTVKSVLIYSFLPKKTEMHGSEESFYYDNGFFVPRNLVLH